MEVVLYDLNECKLWGYLYIVYQVLGGHDGEYM